MKHPTIISVSPGSPAAGAGVVPGEKLVSINGNPIYDVLDFMYHSSEKRLRMLLIDQKGKKRRAVIKNPEFMPLGLEFESFLMDNARPCANKCIFCFIDQLPPGLRETLYFKDDDARLSFLQGNYITLTNLSQRELQRIIELRISPINISVHTTNPELRSFMLQNRRGCQGYETMKHLADAGIEMNCQIVCVPGVNDGNELERSLEDLSALFPQVVSVSVVPVGITKYRSELHDIKGCSKADAEAIIDAVDAYGDMCLNKYGSRIFYCGDELYLKAQRKLPPYEYYENFPQFENGVGMLRSLEQEFTQALDQLDTLDKCSAPPFSIATGVAAGALLINLLQLIDNKCYNVQGNVVVIENTFFGNHVNVAGLITGGDIISQLRGKQLGDRLLIPSSMLRHEGDLFLDNVSVDDLSTALNIPVVPVPNDGALLLKAMLGLEI